jgi:hypothetical protein
MKKIILIFSIIVTFLGIFLTALPSLLRVTGLANPLKKHLVTSLVNGKPYSLNLDDFRIGLGTLELKNVAVKARDHRYDLGVQIIRFGFNISRLIVHFSTPVKALQSVTLIKPYLIIRQKANSLGPEQKPAWANVQEILQKINQKQAIKIFRIEQGEIVYEQKDGRRLILGKNLDGILRSDNFSQIDLSLGGQLFSDQTDQAQISGRVNLQEQKFRFLCKFQQYELAKSTIRHFSGEFKPVSGTIKGWMLLEDRHFDPDSLRLNGELTFSDLVVRKGNEIVQSANFKMVFSDNRVTIDSLTARFASASIAGKAWVDNVFHPHVFIDWDLKNFVPGSFFQTVKQKWYGRIPVDGHLSADFDLPKNKGKLSLVNGKIRLAKEKILENVRSKVLIYPDSIRIAEFSARMNPANRLIVHGLFKKRNQSIHLFARIRHYTATHKIFDRLSQKVHEVNLRLNYAFTSNKIDGTWKYALKDSSAALFAMQGNITGNRNSLDIVLAHSTDKHFKAEVRFVHLESRPFIQKAAIRNFPFEQITSAPFLLPLLQRINSEFELSGPLNRLKVHVLFTDEENPKNQSELLATLSNLLNGTRSLVGLVRIKNISGNTAIKFGEDFLQGNFRFQDQIKGNLSIDLSKERYLNGELQFRNFNVVQALSDSVVRDNFRFLGTLNGKVQLSGDLNNPTVTADLSGDRFVFHDVGYYQAGLRLKADKDSLIVDSAYIAMNNLPVFQGKARVLFSGKNVEGVFSGHNVDLEQIMSSIASNKFTLTGLADYTLHVSGALSRPQLDLNLRVGNGVLDRVAFDELKLHVQNEYLNGGNLFSGKNQILNIDQIRLLKNNKFELNGLGQVPLYSSGDIDLYLNFKGDLFSIIPLYQPFFRKGISDVDLHLALGGTPERLRLSSGYLLINQGELWLKKVVPHIRNITGVIEKKSQSNQVNLINITAESGGEKLTINTVRNVTLADGTRLHPWYFKGIDLDFGVLKMETTGRGVQVHIPNLMLPKYDGRLALSGMKPGESFYFAGPVRHPLLHGKITVYDTRMTFPFIESGSPTSGPNPVIEFLTNIDWDVLVVSGEDVVYTRDIPAYIDNVNTELFVDESSPGLHFKGILSNNTFRVSGKVSSSRGRLEYLDQTFRVDHFQAEFTENSLYPFISGQAWTTIRDSIGAVPKTIYLKLYAVDPETRQEKQQGSLENFKFKLVSADPQIGEDQERVLSYLGFSVGNLREKATSVGGAVTEKYIFRPLFRPIERAIEKSLGIDFVRINSNIAKNLFFTSIGYGSKNFGKNQPLINPFNSPIPYLFLIQSSEVTLGKYLTQNLYLSYTGQLVSVYDKTKPTFDINHSFGIEYRFLRNILLEFEYDRELMGYYKVPNQKQYLEDFKIRLRHSFTF